MFDYFWNDFKQETTATTVTAPAETEVTHFNSDSAVEVTTVSGFVPETTVLEEPITEETEVSETSVPESPVFSGIYSGTYDEFFQHDGWISMQSDISAMRHNSDVFTNALPVYTAIVIIFALGSWFYKTFIR